MKIAAKPKTLKKLIGKRVKAADPLVSVVIPAYHVAEYILETVDSAIAQTFKDFEIIVVNDGSPDTIELENVLADVFDDIIYVSQQNKGVASARNTAIIEARGKFLAFLDADDIWLPEKLESQVNFIEAGDLDMVYCDAFLFGEQPVKSKTFMEKAPSSGPVSPESLLSGECNVLTSATLVKKDLVIKIDMFDENAHRIEDFDLWFRICKNGAKIGYQRDVMLKYRIRPGSLTGTNVERSERTIAALRLVKEKNDFTESENKAWKDQLRSCQAQLSLEIGKSQLAAGNYGEARAHFTEANEFYGKFKLSLMIWLLGVSPYLAFLIFKNARSDEYSAISENDV